MTSYRFLTSVIIALGTIAFLSAAGGSNAAARHPLDPLSGDEIEAAVDILEDTGHVDRNTRYVTVTLREPAKEAVLAWRPGNNVPRRAYVSVTRNGVVFEGIVDLSSREVVTWTEVPGAKAGISLEDFNKVYEIVLDDERMREGLAKRDVDTDQIFCAARTPGYFGEAIEAERRLAKIDCFDMRGVTTNAFQKPIEGLVAVVDLDSEEVIEVFDEGVVPIAPGEHDIDEDSVGELRGKLKRVRLDDTDENIELDGHMVRWGPWRFHLRFDKRLGTVPSLADFDDGGEWRRILYQAAQSELFVPYQDPARTWYYRTYLDEGEYGFGVLSTELQRGLDCPDSAIYRSVLIAGEDGDPEELDNRVCLFERSTANPLWRHAEAVTGTVESRSEVELVVRMITAIGNYDYSLDWVFTQTGAIRIDVAATGIDAVKGVATAHMSDATAAADTAYGTLLQPNLVGINHDHFFSFRIDLDVDGRENNFVKERLVPRALSPEEGPRKSIWTISRETATTDSAAKYDLSLKQPALWRVINPSKSNAVGNPVSFLIKPAANAYPLIDPEDWPMKRAAFVNHHLWVTPYDPDELYAAGTYPNQSKGDDGLATWTTAGRNVQNTDIVVWYTLGFHHVPQAEDWPVMPTAWHGVTLKPFNFFDRNGALNVPVQKR